MKYEKIISLLDSTANQPSKFKTKNLVEVNDNSHGVYDTSSQIEFKTSMLRSSVCDYSVTYILFLK